MSSPHRPFDRSATAPDRVVVTGIGLRTGLGLTREETWRHLKEGRGAFRRLDIPAGSGAPPFFGAPLPSDDRRPIAHGLQTAAEAWSDAGLLADPPDRERTAVVIGMSKGDLRRWAGLHEGRLEDDSWLSSWPNGPASAVATTLDLRGPCLAPIAACATGLVAALQAADLIRRGVCDLALAGAVDLSLEPLVLGAFRTMGVLARVEGDATRAVRPWSRTRSGFLVGEGAAVLVLERASHARARGAQSYVEFAGGALGADAYHATGLNPDPTGLAGLIGRALGSAGVTASELDHVNVHGTATRANDPLECRALRLALGDRALGVSCSANKGQIGHLLGAAGAVELAMTCLALRDGFVPPTANLTDPDPACDLDGTPLVGRARPIRAALKLSIGFGGHLAAAVLRQIDGGRSDPDG